RVDGLAHRKTGVLLPLALEENFLVGYRSKLCWATLSSEQLVECAVHRIDERTHGNVDLASALGARVASLKSDCREIPRTSCIQRGDIPLDLERFGLKRKVGAERLAHVFINDGRYRPRINLRLIRNACVGS